MSHLDRTNLSGKLDGSAYAAFAHGACEAFAVALHDATGWPLVKITDPWNVTGPYDEWGIGHAGDGSGVHWACRDEDGMLVDIGGRHRPQDLATSFDPYVDAPTDDDEAVEENAAKSGDSTPEDAAPYAAILLTQLQEH